MNLSIPDRTDVVIIGGGPGGSSTAAYLAQRNIHAVLFDKQKHPRYSVGESLIPLFWKYTDALGVSEKIMAEGFVRKMGGTVQWKGQIRTHTFKAFGYDRPALHIERDRFDHILLEHAREAGARVFENVAATGVALDHPEGPVVSYRDADGTPGRIACRYVVDASGQNSLLGRQLGIRRIDPDFRYMSVWGYFRNSRYIAFGGKAHPAEEVFQHPPTTFVTSLKDFGDVGWGWHIIMREETSVGFVLPVDQIKAHRGGDENWETYFLRMCRSTFGFKELLEKAEFVPGSLRLIRDYSYQSDRLSGPGYFLVGDAAGFIDPIFSIGVVLAFYSAYIAGWTIERCLKRPENEEDYRKLFEDQLRTRIELSRMLALPSYTPGGSASDMVRVGLAFEGRSSQGLMRTVSRLTSRSENFNRMVGSIGDRELPPGTYITLDGLEF